MRAAALILLLVAAGIFLRQDQNSALRDLYAASTVERQMEDGSMIALRSAAHIRLPESFGKNQRTVEIISGEVFFDVAPETKRPFVVKHPWADVRVVGTSFMVSIDTVSRAYVLIVTEGEVLFAPQLSREVLTISAGSGLKFHADTRIIERIRSIDHNALSWHTGILSFIGEPVESVIADLIDHYRVDIELRDSNAGQCRFTAPLPYQNVPVIDILKALATTFGMAIIAEEEGRYVLKGGGCRQ